MADMEMLGFADPDIPRKNYSPQPDGVEYILVIRIDFSDRPGQKPAEVFDSAIFGTKGTSMRLYFEEVSYGQMHILPGYLGGVMPKGDIWYRAKKPMSYYGAGTIMTNRYVELAEEACTAADAEVDFSKYDRDGDGYLDHLMIIHAGNDEASTGIPEDIWSAEIDTVPGIYDGTKISSAMIVAEDPGNDFINVGIYCHEFLHEFGAPDLYSWDYPVGHWCLMGMFGPYQDEGRHPSHISGYLKWDLDADLSNGAQGWITPIDLTSDGGYSVDSFELATGNRLYKVNIPGKNGKEYFLLENRNKHSGAIYDSYLPESGIIIWHIDETQPKSFSYPHRAWVEDPTDPDRRNTSEATKGAAYSADDGQTSFTPATNPNSNANDGTYSGIIITDIGPEGMSIPFSLFFGDTYEPNDSAEIAYGPIVYGKQYVSFIKSDQDVDFYKLYATANSTIIVYLENIPAGCDYDLQVFDAQKDLIVASTERSQAGKRLVFKTGGDGTYYLAVMSNLGYSPDQPYSLTVDSAPIDLAPGMIAFSKVYPNPGPDEDDCVWFEYKLLAPVEKLSVEIYTFVGTLVYTYSTQPTSRTSRIAWNTRLDSGAKVASGVYIYVIKAQAHGKVETKTGKIALVF